MVNSKFLYGDLHDIYVNRHKARAKQFCITTEYRGNAVIDENNNICVIENDMITKRIDIKNSITYTVHDENERDTINEYLFSCVILKYAKLIAYFGNITWISIDVNVLEEYRKLEL